jgi:hypothetical protein
MTANAAETYAAVALASEIRARAANGDTASMFLIINTM